MKRSKKNILSLLLVLMLTVSLIPSAAFADEGVTAEETAATAENEEYAAAKAEAEAGKEIRNAAAETEAGKEIQKAAAEESALPGDKIVLKEESRASGYELYPDDSLKAAVSSMSAECLKEEAQFGLNSVEEGWYHLVLRSDQQFSFYRYYLWHRDDTDTAIETKQFNQSDNSVIDCYILLDGQSSYSFGLYFEGAGSADLTANFTYIGTIGDAGPDIYASFDETSGTLSLSGSGGMWDEFDPVVWGGKSWGFDIKKLVIGENITRIGNGMFSNQYFLEEVSFPSTLEEIGIFAFGLMGPQDNDYERGLRPEASVCTFDIPEGVVKIDNAAFADRVNDTVLLPESLEEINGRLFNIVPARCTLHVYRGSYADTFAQKEGYRIVYRESGHTHSFGKDGFCTGCGEFIFGDVTGKKSREYVSWAYENDIVKGTGEDTFSPDDSCTRVQFVMMMWKMMGSPVVDGVKNPFSDISGSKTIKAITWALDAGIINAADRFNPNDSISRVQIVMMLWKMAGSPSVDTAGFPFEDVTGNKTMKAVMWAYNNSITKGTSDTTFAPDNDCTRLQLVIFLYKFNGLMQVI